MNFRFFRGKEDREEEGRREWVERGRTGRRKEEQGGGTRDWGPSRIGRGGRGGATKGRKKLRRGRTTRSTRVQNVQHTKETMGDQGTGKETEITEERGTKK